MIRQLPIIAAFGLGSAVLYSAVLGAGLLGIILAYLAQLPLFLAGLSLGSKAAAIAGAIGVIALGALGGVWTGLVYGATTVIPVVILVALALKSRTWSDGRVYWYPAGHLLRALAVLCAVMLVMIALALMVGADGFRTGVETMIQGMAEALTSATGQELPAQSTSGLADILPGITSWSWMLMATVNGLLAQLMLRRMGRNLRPSPAMAEIAIPLTWCAAFGAAALLGMLLPADFGYVLFNVAIILAYPVLFQGLSVVHAAFAQWNTPTAGYVVFYGVLALLSWLALGLIAVGLAEPIIKLRERLARSKKS